MKRVIRILVLIGFISFVNINMYGDDIFNIEDIENEVKEEAENQLTPVVKYFSAGFNGGLFASSSGKLFSVGLQANVVKVPDEGVLADASTVGSYIPIPYAYAGVRIPFIGISGMARGLIIPLEDVDKYPTVIGLGIGWETSLIPLINSKIMITYHWIANFPYLDSLSSLYPNITFSFTKIPFITPYLNAGLSYNKIVTSITLPGDSEKFGFSKVYMNMAIGVKIFFFNLEMGMMPLPSYSISAGFSF